MDQLLDLATAGYKFNSGMEMRSRQAVQLATTSSEIVVGKIFVD
jgi:hypothetical protein